MKILGISGSLRAASSNARLLRAIAALAPEGWTFTFFDQEIGRLPHFSPDLDQEGASAAESVAEFRGLVRACDGVLISCPEYAHGVPGAFKNALDWLVSSGELSAKPVALLMASPSGAEYARAALTPTLEVLEADLVFEASLVFAAAQHLGANGQLIDAELIDAVERSLAALARAHQGSPDSDGET
jgi:chromate reductase, NAD(P)H dehydrogenase (quinone)